ncbi:MAG: hypothetical protein ABI091_16585, partial [Ferruginibacter sp.]
LKLETNAFKENDKTSPYQRTINIIHEKTEAIIICLLSKVTLFFVQIMLLTIELQKIGFKILVNIYSVDAY